MRAPGFWQRGGLLPRLLTPAAWVYATATARRLARPGWRAPVPVICCGNAGAGGSGKTPLALALATRLLARGATPALLTRGYGGRLRGPIRVTATHQARDVGDEAMLLAAVAPCYVGADRAATARLAVADGASVLVMDDGLQNPTLHKDFAILVIDGAEGFGNARVMPAGPLREPVSAAAARCGAAVVIGADLRGAVDALPAGLPVLRGHLQSEYAPSGVRVVAFAGIGRPEKFFASLTEAGAELVARFPFPDHHRYRPADLRRVTEAAVLLDAMVVTTPKDAVRLTPAMRGAVRVVGVSIVWDDPAALDALLDKIAP